MEKVISVFEKIHRINPLIVAMIRHSGRSWWQARYSNGKVVSEWDTLTDKIKLPIGLGRSSRWEEVPKKDMVGLRLLCPNGMCGELEAPEGHKFIQLKAGGVMAGGGRFIDAHIIGVIIDANGKCFCRAWEYQSKQLIEFYDNVFDMKYLHIGPLYLEVQGVKV